MSPLRERMIEDMQLHGFSASTQDVYVRAVSELSKYVHHGPDKVTEEELRRYFLHLTNEKKSSRFHHNGRDLRNQVFYKHTLRQDWPTLRLARPAPEYKLPVVLSREEVRRLLAEVRKPVSRVCLTTIYSCGLRLMEGVRLRGRRCGQRAHGLDHSRQGKAGPPCRTAGTHAEDVAASFGKRTAPRSGFSRRRVWTNWAGRSPAGACSTFSAVPGRKPALPNARTSTACATRMQRT